MRTGLFNRSDLNGGAAVSAMRLFNRLKADGVDVEYLVGIKHGHNGSRLMHPKSDLFAKVRNLAEQYLLRKRNGGFPFSLSVFPFPLGLLIRWFKLDVVHLHWIGAGFISISSLSRIRKPIIWTLHDSWPFTGGCHLPYECRNYLIECGKCPELNSVKEKDLSRCLNKRKQKTYRKIRNITFVSPSRWLADAAAKSSLLKNQRIVVIPNGLDTNVFLPKGKPASRALLNISSGSKMILFGAVNSTTDKNKGFQELLDAIGMVKHKPVELMVFGADGNELVESLGIKTHFLGRITDETKMAALYSAADVTVVPSRSENLSNVIMESLACGTPVVAFRIGGNSDMVEHQQNGYLAEPYKTEDLAMGLDWVLQHPEPEILSANARKKIGSEFEIGLCARRYTELYTSRCQ